MIVFKFSLLCLFTAVIKSHFFLIVHLVFLFMKQTIALEPLHIMGNAETTQVVLHLRDYIQIAKDTLTAV